MQLTDVFAVEVRQYVSPDKTHRTLVPRLIGKGRKQVIQAQQGVDPGNAGIEADLRQALELSPLT